MSIMEEYLSTDGFITRRRSAEEGHTKRCLAAAALAAIENMRDAEDVSDFEFSCWLQESGPNHLAHDYLNVSELSDCLCPPVVEEEKHYLRIRSRDAYRKEWRTEVHYMTLSDAVAMVSDDLESGFWDMAWIGLDDSFDPNTHPCLWASVSYGTEIIG